VSAPFNRFNGTYDQKHYLKGGELLFAWSGTPGTSFGAHMWGRGEALLNQHIFRVDFDDVLLDRRFFRHAINQKLTELIGVAHGGAGLQHVTKGVFESTEVALPPRPEQKRIADKLDTVLTRVDAVNERLARVAPILKRFRQSVLAAATSGRLTEGWRASRASNGPSSENTSIDVPLGWRQATFSEVCTEITVGFVGSMAREYVPSGIPFLRSMNIRAFRFDPKGIQFITPEFHAQIKKSKLRAGDLAIVRSGAPGVCCVIPDDLGEANCSDLVIARPGPQLVAAYGCIFMNSSFGASHVASKQVGVAQAHFNVGAMKATPLPLPSVTEQIEIVRRVETLFAFADRLEARLQAAQTAADRLTPSLLAKAFRGELVPQDPNDEPAAELLKRLATSVPVSKTKRVKAKATKLA
jgi:type I restriction enzyme S subunit